VETARRRASEWLYQLTPTALAAAAVMQADGRAGGGDGARQNRRLLSDRRRCRAQQLVVENDSENPKKKLKISSKMSKTVRFTKPLRTFHIVFILKLNAVQACELRNQPLKSLKRNQKLVHLVVCVTPYSLTSSLKLAAIHGKSFTSSTSSSHQLLPLPPPPPLLTSLLSCRCRGCER
jgi:hypothetical protein